MTATLVERTTPATAAMRRPEFLTGEFRTVLDDLDARFQTGTDAVLAEAYAEHGSLVYTFAKRQLDVETAQDVTQEVFVAAWKARDRFDHRRGPLRAWLIGIAKNKVIDHHRRRARRPQIAGGVEVDVTLDRTGHERDVEQMADRMALAAALDELPDRARTVVELSFFEQLTHPEIAERTGVPLGTVKSDIRRSLTRLRQYVERDDA